MTIFRRLGPLFRRTKAVHRLRLYSRNEILRALKATGFQASVADRYDPGPLPPGVVGFIACKPFTPADDPRSSELM
jgi:hypothetical protein